MQKRIEMDATLLKRDKELPARNEKCQLPSLTKRLVPNN